MSEQFFDAMYAHHCLRSKTEGAEPLSRERYALAFGYHFKMKAPAEWAEES